jgi:hypothetical protein
MPKHEYFQELCSLAVLGEMSTGELIEWTAHLRECAHCQAAYGEFTELVNEHLSLADRGLDRPSVIGTAAAASLRGKTLERVVAEGLRISPEALRGPVGLRARVAEQLDNVRWAMRARMVPLAITSAVLLAVGITGLLLRHNLFQKHEMEVLRADLSQTQNYALQLKAKLNQAAQAESRTATDTQRLERQLADAGARAARLEAEHEQDVKAIRSLQDQVAGLTSENAGVARRASASDEELASLRGQLQQLRAAAADKENQLSVVQFQIAELSSRLKAQESALERERQLLAAGRDIRDLMGARNLHIIDVHDMDARGESRPFGRIFLTEGKRLIFYAYDLDSAKIKNASFQAWGQSSDDTRAAVSLGILYMDDQKQSRWALKVEDPDLLKALDSVFVTVEPRGGTERPTGKKLMYAFLRNPINHP